jgi:iron complex outermembrane receptor protein
MSRMNYHVSRTLKVVPFLFVVASGAVSLLAQSQPQDQDPMRLPPVTVNVYKEPDDAQDLPVSVTAVSGSTLRDDFARKISDAAIYSPNLFISEFTARKLSNARFRGIGSGPNNPGVTTYIDGVPQLNTNSSSLEFIDIDQVEFVRGTQSTLFGRNTLGGLINVTSARPKTDNWGGTFSAPFGNYSEWDTRASVSGPLTSNLALRLSAGRGKRDGFTINDTTGNDLDHRATTYGKAQLWWTSASSWAGGLIVAGERANDGDYALNDLAALRSNPFHSSRSFEGYTKRDVLSTTGQIHYAGPQIDFSSTTGLTGWKTRDLTDLDYTATPLISRTNVERDTQFTQEVRIASAPGKGAQLGNVKLKWQTGVFVFDQNYDQDAINNYSPFLLSPFITFPVSQHTPMAALDDKGIGFYGQTTATLRDKLDLTGGVRFDYEKKEAVLNTFYSPAIAPPNTVNANKGFSNVSPNFAAAYRTGTGQTFYGSVGRGYKAGGFNAASPTGSEIYAEELAWHYEGGVKSLLANGRVSVTAAAFFIDWDHMQLNVPNPGVPGQFYVRNVGAADSKGMELGVNVRPVRNVDLFASYGLTHARFDANTTSGGVNVSGKKIPSAPDNTVTVGASFTRPLTAKLLVYGRGEVWINGGFEYDDANTQRQASYSLTNFSGGVRHGHFFIEGFLKNAFDTRYIPIAFAYTGLAPSGFVGEMGAPRRFGVNLGVTF